MTQPAEWRLLSRPGCHLCEEFLDELTTLLPAGVVAIQRCNVDDRDDWRSAFGRRIPVLLDAADQVLYVADSPVPLEHLRRIANP